MSEEYVRAKIKEAMDVCGGDRHDAQKLVVTWAVRDTALLIGLCKPHLKAVVAARFEQIGKTPRKAGGDDPLLTTRAAGEKRASVVPPPRSSSRQASVMHQIAAAFKNKKKS